MELEKVRELHPTTWRSKALTGPTVWPALVTKTPRLQEIGPGWGASQHGSIRMHTLEPSPRRTHTDSHTRPPATCHPPWKKQLEQTLQEKWKGHLSKTVELWMREDKKEGRKETEGNKRTSTTSDAAVRFAC